MLPPTFRLDLRYSVRASILTTLGIAVLFSAFAVAARPARADSWALLIGIDQYEDSGDIASLGGADNDANALAKTLIESAGFPAAHVHVLTSSTGNAALKPSRHNILHELEALRSRVRPGDTVFIAFSGHGVDSDGVPYLLPYDADIATPALIRDSSIPEEKFREYLKSVPAKALILVFDMCRVNVDKSGRAGVVADAHLSGEQVRGLDFTNIVKDGGGAANALATPADHPQIVAEFFACSPNYRSYEWKAKERGYFSYFLEQGLRGQAASARGGGSVSLDALKRYLATAVPTAVHENELGKDQTPTGDIVGPLDAGDFVLVANASAPTPAAVAVSPVVTPRDTVAHLTVKVNAPNATILLDGKPITPGQEASLDLGPEKTHEVEIGIAAEGYQALHQKVQLTAGAHSTLPVTLAVLPPPHVERPAQPAVRPTSGAGPAAVLVKINTKDGAAMVYVPAGPFLMGDNDMTGRGNPRHKVTLSGYYIYKNLVTVAMYRKFCDATGRQMPAPPTWGWKDDHPIVNVTWDEAKAYCAWAGVKLPTETQWEKAARGTEGRMYPWGDSFDVSKLWASKATAGDAGGTAPVGSFPSGASPYGVMDMAGNVEQWCEDFYDKGFWSSSRSEQPDPVNETLTTEGRVLRGCSWFTAQNLASVFRTAQRSYYPPAIRVDRDGFRAAVPAE